MAEPLDSSRAHGTARDRAKVRASDAHSAIPALDRAISIMAFVEARPHGCNAQQLAALGIPRTSLYRILAMLCASGYLSEVPGASSSYALGPAIGRMAARMPVADDLPLRVQPILERLVAATGETAKVVVRDGLETVAVAVCQPTEDSRIASRINARLPLHVGAGQRLLLSRAPAHVIEAVMTRPLLQRGPETIVDHRVLQQDLARLRKREWALGSNEGASGVGSIGALIHEPGREPRAALVLLYILSGRMQREVNAMRDTVVAAAAELTR